MTISALSVAACKSLPPVQPESDKAAALGVQVELVAPLSLFGGQYAEKVYLVRVNGGEVKTKAGIISSTWTNGERTYVFNVEPGEYAIVAAEYSVTSQGQTSTAPVGGNATLSVTTGGGTSVYTTFMPRDVVEASRIKVEAGKLAFMGAFVVKMSKGFDEADDVQKHYAEILAPGSTTASGVAGFFQTKYSGRMERKTGQEGRAAFLHKAREDFGETRWSSYTQD